MLAGISPTIVIDNWLVIAEDFIIILPIWAWPYHMLTLEQFTNSMPKDWTTSIQVVLENF